LQLYRFRLVTGSNQTDRLLRFESDGAALAYAKETLVQIGADAVANARSAPDAIEVIRADDTVVGLVVPD
jgi:hypothetical protein